MISRTLFSSEHEEYRRQVKRFLTDEIMPHHERWEDQQHVDRSIWNRARALGHLCQTMPEEYGGAGVDRLFSVVQMEESTKAGASGLGFGLHSDIVANYINNFGSHEQKLKYLPAMATGELVGAIAMTEPGTGSDLQAIKTTAVLDGDHYVLNGSKTFITNGLLSDMVVVVVKTGDSLKGAQNLSLLLVDAKSEGFSKGKPLKKIGMKAQDTCELFFDNVEVPRINCSVRREKASSC
ncbi:Acyl-CoA dehydrogenase [Pseudomonas sp. 25 R 14]|nr:Acyl-CoA dehydrogenase [Pseudomonas sp. 25 R 14]